MKAMINAQELADLLTIKPYKARQIIRSINEQLTADGFCVLHTRPPQAPFSKVREYLKGMGIELEERTDERHYRG